MKFLIGYMILSSASLLGVLGDYMATIAIEIYRIPIDILTYYSCLYNFAIVGIKTCCAVVYVCISIMNAAWCRRENRLM